MADWTEVVITTTSQGLEPVGAMLTEIGLPSFMIQDAGDFEEFLEGKSGHWDYIEDDLMKLREAPTTITVYLSELEQGQEQMMNLTAGLQRLKALDEEQLWGALTLSTQWVHEEDWSTAWKQYYHPLSIGNLTICPSWESEDFPATQTVIKMDPGMAFGTGTHESTSLCLELLQTILKPDDRILDIGCGSGILSIGAVALGASFADGIDIDQVAVKVANENAALNHLENKTSFLQGSFTQTATGEYDIIFANIVADAILSLLPDIPQFLKSNGSLICSGIIDTRADEIITAIQTMGLVLADRRDQRGWVALRVTK